MKRQASTSSTCPASTTPSACIRKHKVAAVLVFKSGFSDRINHCSFLADPGGINPFHRDGVYLDRIDAELLSDPKQPGAAAIIDQVAQVSLIRVILPWMIGGRSSGSANRSSLSCWDKRWCCRDRSAMSRWATLLKTLLPRRSQAFGRVCERKSERGCKTRWTSSSSSTT